MDLCSPANSCAYTC